MNEFNPNGFDRPDETTPMDMDQMNSAQSDMEINKYAAEQTETTNDDGQFRIDLSAGENSQPNPGVNEIPALVRNVPYNEHVKKTRKQGGKSKRFVAAMVSVTVLNLAIMGGMYALGRSTGSSDNKVASKQSLIDSLQNNGSGEASSENHAVSTANTAGEMDTTEIAKKVGPAVVGITSEMQGQMSIFGGYSSSKAEGSGIIMSADGYIATNNHVIDGATKVIVTLNTGTEYEAQIVGADAQTDLAVIKITPSEELTVATFGDSSTVQVGERAIAIGNPMGLEFQGSVTQGIVSAVNRSIQIDNRTMNLIQTDAAINSGNSGGALVNGKGEVIGINAVKVEMSGVEGMGFAIPISEAKTIISDLLEHGYVKGRPIIGVSTRDVTDYMAKQYKWPQGAQVMEITSQNAKDAGLEQGDIITSVDGQAITTGQELSDIKDQRAPGDELTLEVYKYSTGLKTTIKVTLTEQIPG